MSVQLVFNPGRSDEVVVRPGDHDVRLVGLGGALRGGNDAQRLTSRMLDLTGAAWPLVRFGSIVELRVHSARAFVGTVVVRRRAVMGAGVLLVAEAVGRTQALYSETVQRDKTYVNTDTADIARDLVTTHFADILTVSGIPAATGVVVAEFEVTEGENVGEVLERLNKQDGYTFRVDLDDVAYYTQSLSSVATITEADLAGSPEEGMVEDGVMPPRNIVHVAGRGSAFGDRTRHEDASNWYALNADTRRAAQRFVAKMERLSAVELYVDRTLDPNIPASLQIEVREEGEMGLSRFQNSSAAGGYDLDSTSRRAAQTFTTPSDVKYYKLRFIHLNHNTVGAPGPVAVAIHAVDASGHPTGPPLATTTVGGDPDLVLDGGTQYAAVLVPSAPADGANFHRATNGTGRSGGQAYTSTDGGASWTAVGSVNDDFYLILDLAQVGPGALVEWSDTISLSAGQDAQYPPQWTSRRSYAQPLLRLTPGAHYWLVLRDGAATVTKHWSLSHGPTPDDEAVAQTSTDSGASWAALAGPLAHRLYWAEGPIDVKRTNSAARLSAAMTAGQLTVPLDEVRDFDTFPLVVRIGAEDILVTGRSAEEGAGDLTGATRGHGGTTPATHDEGARVVANSCREYGLWPYEEKNDQITSHDAAVLVAQRILQEHAEPRGRMTLPLRDAAPDRVPGDVVRVVRPALLVDEEVMVLEVRHELGENSNPRTTLLTGALEYNAARAVEAIRREAA